MAKGAGAIAAKIRERATEHRVPMVEDVPLARALHRSCEIGQEVPAELFQAVARVLALVMSLKRRGSAAGLHRPTPSAADLHEPRQAPLAGGQVRPASCRRETCRRGSAPWMRRA